MKHITFYLDFVSPYAYLAFEQLPQALMGISHSVGYQPVLVAGLLGHHGQSGPAEIPAKRDWTYREVLWQAQQLGIDLQMPAAHPFNPLALLRLATACGAATPLGLPNRFVCETLFRHVWRGGQAADDAQRIDALLARLSDIVPGADLRALMAGDAAKAALRTRTDDAIARGVFGVPSFEVDGKVFWGLDALPMLRSCLLGDAWFEGPGWDAVRDVPVGVSRR